MQNEGIGKYGCFIDGTERILTVRNEDGLEIFSYDMGSSTVTVADNLRYDNFMIDVMAYNDLLNLPRDGVLKMQMKGFRALLSSFKKSGDNSIWAEYLFTNLYEAVEKGRKLREIDLDVQRLIAENFVILGRMFSDEEMAHPSFYSTRHLIRRFIVYSQSRDNKKWQKAQEIMQSTLDDVYVALETAASSYAPNERESILKTMLELASFAVKLRFIDDSSKVNDEEFSKIL
jgi:hypothetical protein